MSKFIDYLQITALDSSHVLLVDGNTGTKKILASDAILQMIGMISPEAHFAIPRGKNLGSAPTAAQKAAIRNRTYEDIFLADYWQNNGVKYRIADRGYISRCGDTDFTGPNIQIVPDTILYSHVMNDTNTTEGGYVGSKMYKEGLESAKTTIQNIFGDMLITHREYLTNAVTNGKPSGGGWFDSTVELMNELMVYGSHIFAPLSDGSTVPTNYTIGKSQLALFRVMPELISNRQWFWLRDVVSGAIFADVGNNGDADYRYASFSAGVRPVFSIG
ncbi:MAG: hypothetical protein IJ523_07050 [Succinivibrionaceae bacterium]|nr:hypothetical protein [Succinivibrionaceae bacterium]